jgi:hypothetical protein
MSVAFWKVSDQHLEKWWNTDWPTIKAGSSAAHDPTMNIIFVKNRTTPRGT